MDELLRTPVRTLHELARRGHHGGGRRGHRLHPGRDLPAGRCARAGGGRSPGRAGRPARAAHRRRPDPGRPGGTPRGRRGGGAPVGPWRGHGGGGPLHLGIFGGTAAAVLPAVLEAVEERHPALRLTSRELDVDDAAGAVRRGDVDVAFGLDYSSAPIPRSGDVQLVLLRTERFGLVTADGADRDPGALAELADFADAAWVLPPAGTHYGEAIRSACRLAGFEPRAAHELLDTVATLTLASRGAGLAPATPMMLGLVPGLPLRMVELAQQLRRDVVLVRREADAHRDKVAAVTATVRAVVQACPNTQPTPQAGRP